MSDTGRAARVRLERRLATARHGAELLDRKRRILADEVERLELQTARSRQVWEQQAREAALWLRRAAALDGSERIEAAAAGRPATAEIRWGGVMGVAYPEDTRCHLPPVTRPGGGSALALAAAAHRDALVAAVACAAAQRAEQLVAAELVVTRTRQRAVEHRWVPRLEERLGRVRRALAELELEESLRLRWAAGAASRPGAGPARAAGGSEGR
ncbi:V-type ATP synthase subunit D [Cellulomonas sp. KRMCY2]|uniref:V-type ATP synthase subunit D n=1 Tax=Cellulomonas sp. KRMCY2 TaxID=1304865 RepID=UPI00045E90D8|nr:V-type ATP synthase subunit D [Cellulomonas sp. KRMCY2]